MPEELYKVIKQSATNNSLNVRMKLNEKHPIFAGHFPEQPVMPGVCMVQIVKELLTQQLNEKVNLKQSRNMKFLSVIDPRMQQEVNLAIDYRKNGNSWEVSAKIFENETLFFKLENGIFSL